MVLAVVPGAMDRYVFDAATGRLHGYSASHEVLVLAWPELMAYRKSIRSPGWQGWTPDFPLVADTPGEAALQAFIERTPVEVRRLVGRYYEHHWELLKWFAIADYGADDLSVASPALAFMLALSHRFVRRSEGVRQPSRPSMLAFRKQRHVLGWLGFPGTESARRLIARILPEAVSVSALLALRTELARAGVPPQLPHAPHVNADVLLLTKQGAMAYLSPSMLDTIAKPTAEAGRTSVAAQVATTLALWRRLKPNEPPPVFDSIAQVRAVRRELSAMTRPPRPSKTKPEFPTPPFPGTDSIIPLTTRRMLAEEGRSQHNCVSTYARRVLAGRVVIYRVLAPERCTLSLVKRAKVWTIEQLLAACNAAVQPGTRAVIRAWLQTENRSAAAPSKAQPTDSGA